MTPPARSSRDRHPGLRLAHGFTLLELMLVLVLLGMMYALTPPIFSISGSTSELKAAARQVAAGLRKARAQAVLNGVASSMVFDVEARRFRLDGADRLYRLPESARIEVFTADSEVSADTRRAAIRFYPDGSSTGGRVTLAMGDREMLVDVDWLTGRVEVLDSP